jgi:vacuolar protein sorting-associated protein 13A/C
MFESLVENLISKIMGEYIEGLNKKDIKVGILSGKVEIKNLRLHPQLFHKLGFPFKILIGKIALVKLKIPWKNLQSMPVVVDVDGIYALISPSNKGTTNKTIGCCGTKTNSNANTRNSSKWPNSWRRS